MLIRKGWLWCFVASIGIVVAAVLGVNQHRVVSVATISNWGLGFRADGEPPTGNASREYLAQYNAHFLGKTSVNEEETKTLYLTFDAGYENGYTASILDTLKKHKVSACFFLVKHYIDTAPDLVKRMVEEGHTVGNHTAGHPDMSTIQTKESFEKELTELEQAYEALIGQPMKKLYRPPQGKYSEHNLQLAHEMGYHTFFWSLAYVDWNVNDQPSRETAFSKLLTRVHPGAIVLLHSTSATNAAVLDELLSKWKSMGYTFAGLETLMC